MTYQGRGVLSGIYRGRILNGFFIQSRSDSQRVILSVGDGAVLVPAQSRMPELMRQLSQGDLSITHNCYPCLFGFNHDDTGHIIACNGRFAGGAKNEIMRSGIVTNSAIEALRLSDARKDDPRLIALAYDDGRGKPTHVFGSYDGDGAPKVICRGIEDGRAMYLSTASHREPVDITLPGDLPDLAMFLYESMLGEDPEGGIGAAICMYARDGRFDVEVFPRRNPPTEKTTKCLV